MPGAIKHILSTRPLDPDLIKRAKEEGLEVDAFSFIGTSPVQSHDLNEIVRTLAAKPQIILFTSVNAVEAVAEMLNRVSREDHCGAGWTVFCIGHATRAAIAGYFSAAEIAGMADNAVLLADEIIEWFRSAERDGEAVFFCGDRRRDVLPGRLAQAGIPLREVVVYRTDTVRHKLSVDYAGVLFFSPSAVESFFTDNTGEAGTVFFAIGETTAQAIREYSSNPVVVSRSPGKEQLMEQVIEYYKEH